MRGNPQYKLGDIVDFVFNKDQIKTGIVAIVDAYGTLSNPFDASYDILIKEENTLYKHITESFVVKKVGESEPTQIWD